MKRLSSLLLLCVAFNASSIKADGDNDIWTGRIYPDKKDKTNWIPIIRNESGSELFTSSRDCKTMARAMVRYIKDHPEMKASIRLSPHGNAITKWRPSYECGLNCKDTDTYKAKEIDKLFGQGDIGSLDELNGIRDCEKIRK